MDVQEYIRKSERGVAFLRDLASWYRRNRGGPGGDDLKLNEAATLFDIALDSLDWQELGKQLVKVKQVGK